MDDQPTKVPFSNAQWTMIFDYMVRVDRLTDRAEFSGPNREANAALFIRAQHMDPLVEAVEALGVLPDGYCFCGRTNAGPHDPECRDVRDILAKIKGGAK